MLLIVNSLTSKNLVKLEGTESSMIFTMGWGDARADVGNVIRVGMQFVEHGFGNGSASVG